MKLIKTIIIFLLIHVMTAAQDTDSYLNGVAAMSKGDLPVAIVEFSSAIDQTSWNSDVYIKRARYITSGKNTEMP